MDLKGELTRKVGPLPVWGWIAVGGGALAFYEYRKSRTSSSSTTAASSPATDSGTVTPDYSSAGGGGLDSGTAGDTTNPDATSYTGSGGYANRSGENSGVLQQILSAVQGLGSGTAAAATSSGSSTAGLGGTPINLIPIKTQLQLLADGQITASQLGPNAKKVLNAAGGNVTKAIASRSTAAATAHPAAATRVSPAPLVSTAISTVGGAVAKVTSGSNGAKPAAIAPSTHAPAPAKSVTVPQPKPAAASAKQVEAATVLPAPKKKAK